MAQPQGNGNNAAGSWLIQIEHEFDLHKNGLRRRSFGNVSIYRVPKFMKASMEEAYAPQVVAFGPYHHTINSQLSAMDKHKVDAVHRTLARMKNGVTIHDLIAKIEDLESAIRDCYEESIECEGKTFAWMFTMDACFILEFFRTSLQERQQSDPDYVSLVFQDFNHFNLLKRNMLTDIMKLENQIPLFIFISILELECNDREEAVFKLSEMLSVALNDLPPLETCVPSLELNTVIKDAYHLLDVWRRIISVNFPKLGNVLTDSLTSLAQNNNTQSLIRRPKFSAWIRVPRWFSWWMQRDNPDENTCTPPAESLQNVGIKFKAAMDGKLRFDRRVWLRKSILFLPTFYLVDNSEIYVRNVLAFEECHKCISGFSGSDSAISSLMMLMDFLVNTEKDAAILRRAGIIQVSAAGSDEEVAAMFNKICKGVTFVPGNEVALIIEQLNDYYYSRFHQLISMFKEEYCSKPWYIISVVAATIALVMTAMQTYYSAKTYEN